LFPAPRSRNRQSFIEFASLLSLGYLGLVIARGAGGDEPLPFPEQTNVARRALLFR